MEELPVGGSKLATRALAPAAFICDRGVGMRALVTGGAGFIGSSVVERFLDMGWEVTVLDDFSSGYEQNCFPAARLVVGDVRSPDSVATAMQGCDVVCHLAASVGNQRSIDDPRHDAQTNYLGTLTVLESARRCGISRVVFSSSAGVFGELKTLPIAEDHPAEPDSPYGVSKLAAEKLCLVFNKLHGMSNVCLRYFNVYGVRQRYDAYGNVILIFAENALRGASITVFGDGRQTRDFVNVGDVAKANVTAALHPSLAGVFNLGSASRVTIDWLAHEIQRLAGTNVDVQYGPPRPGDVRDSLADVTLAARRFGYEPSVDLEDGLHDYLSWLRDDMVSAAKRAEVE